ncbi:MAG: LPS-assembly protein LptD, partial [Paramuribaculum sp.]|nr:LPS-assembly protein LptD [Paramuribaculum sp.]
NNNTFKRKKAKSKTGYDKTGKNGNETDSDDPMSNAPNADRDPRGNIDNDIDLSSDGYMKWDVPWNLSFNYSIGYAYGKFNKRKMDYDGKITQNLSFSGNIRPTANWNFSFSASYNFETHKIAYMNCNITRDLHCFSMRASFVPVGPYTSYNFHISVNSSLLQDVKYDKRSSIRNGVTWY